MVKKIQKSRAYTRLVNYVLDRLGEASTLRGVVVLAATVMYNQSPENLEQIVTVAGIVVGAIGAGMSDRRKKKVDQTPEQQEQE